MWAHVAPRRDVRRTAEYRAGADLQEALVELAADHGAAQEGCDALDGRALRQRLRPSHEQLQRTTRKGAAHEPRAVVPAALARGSGHRAAGWGGCLQPGHAPRWPWRP
jgi:hypothetical protein